MNLHNIDSSHNIVPSLSAGLDGSYRYTRHLKLMQLSKKGMRPVADTRLAGIRTPLNLRAWERGLRNHPDKDYTQCILKGIEHGFPIGVQDFQSASQNMHSAREHPEIIEAYLSYIVSMLPSYLKFAHCHTSR